LAGAWIHLRRNLSNVAGLLLKRGHSIDGPNDKKTLTKENPEKSWRRLITTTLPTSR
jgi:hypothetical protein